MWWLAFLLFTSVAKAEESNSQLVTRAQGLVRKKQRVEACAILVKGIKELTPSAKTDRGRLIEELARVSQVFVTDKGQKHFEAAQAALYESPDVALSRLMSANEVEHDNALVWENVTRAKIVKQDCEGAREAIQHARVMNPFSSSAALLELNALACLNDWDSVREKMKTLPSLSKSDEPFLHYLNAREALEQQQFKRAMDLLTRVTEELPAFPEAYIGLATAAKKLGKDGESWQTRYVSLCKVISNRERRRYGLEPRLCLRAKEVQDELANKTTDI